MPDELLHAFRLHGLASGHSPRTIDAREATVHQLARAHDLNTVTTDELVTWIAGQELARSSRATYRAQLRAFFGWMQRTGRRADNPALDLPPSRAPRGVSPGHTV
jgi:integrase/recombinase XerD